MGYFAKGRQAFADKLIDWNNNRLLAYLLDVDDLGPADGAWKVNAASYSAPYVTLGTTAAHGVTAGQELEVFSVAGISSVNGIFTVFDAPTTTTLRYVPASTPSGTYTAATGYIVNLTSPTYLSDINGRGTADIAKIALAVTGRNTSNGYLDAPDAVWTGVTGDPVEMMAVVKAADTDVSTNDNTESVQRLILCMTSATPSLTGLPQTPTAGNINLNFNSQGLGRI